MITVKPEKMTQIICFYVIMHKRLVETPGEAKVPGQYWSTKAMPTLTKQ